MDINFNYGDITLNVRVAGVYIENGKVLMSRHKNSTFKNLPGGRIKLGEDSISALKREYMEELDKEIEIISEPFILENFYNRNNVNYHEYLFVYLININNIDNFIKDDLVFSMEDKDEILKMDIRPIRVKEFLLEMMKWKIYQNI